jgi:hypothetical protein
LVIWKQVFNSANNLPTTATALAQVFAAQGDGVMLRLRKHVLARQFHLDEQIDRNTGAQISAKDLTWSVSSSLPFDLRLHFGFLLSSFCSLGFVLFMYDSMRKCSMR